MFHQAEFPNLLVGLDQPDDAAVWRISPEQAFILSVDFFTPVVDDPYDWGAIAAANALSDIYAMAGEPLLALNVAALPAELPDEMVAAILRGSADQVRAAGAVVAGGHTIDDDEPKFGLCVLGQVHPQRIGTKGGAQPGDVLLLTKPLGNGIIVTAAKADLAVPEHLAEAVGWMKALNQEAARLLQQVQFHALTDVTGFSLPGHAFEMAEQSGVRIQIPYSGLPFMAGAVHYAEELLFPAAASNNAEAYANVVQFREDFSYEQRLLIFCPETSGGLLISLSPEQAEEYQSACHREGQPVWQVGRVTAGTAGIDILA